MYKRQVHDNGVASSGIYLEVEPHHRLVFTYGWESGPFADMAPGSTTVEVRFEPLGSATLVTIQHSAVPAEFSEAHAAGWQYFLGLMGDHVDGVELPAPRLPAMPEDQHNESAG